jgi:hypothetical protein
MAAEAGEFSSEVRFSNRPIWVKHFRLSTAAVSMSLAGSRIGRDRSSILFVANHAFDCIGAKSYGMRSAFIDRRKRPFGQTPHKPDLIVANFTELAAALA